jgi:hypothetical protein
MMEERFTPEPKGVLEFNKFLSTQEIDQRSNLINYYKHKNALIIRHDNQKGELNQKFSFG